MRPDAYEAALGDSDDATRDSKVRAIEARVPACADAGCVNAVGKAFGRTQDGVQHTPPDQPSAAAAALLIHRDGHGDWLPETPLWNVVIREGHGAGSEALRLAASDRLHAWLARGAGHEARTDGELRAFLHEAVAILPGACVAYGTLAAGGAVNALSPQDHPDTSACVRTHLESRSGPGGRYGTGVNRAAAGALAALHELTRELRTSSATSTHRALLEHRLEADEPALEAVRVAFEDVPRRRIDDRLRQAHEAAGIPFGDAGAPLDAGP